MITLRHTTLGRTPVDEWQPPKRPQPDSTQRSKRTDTHANSEVRTGNPSERAAADPHLKPRSQWDRPSKNLFALKMERDTNTAIYCCVNNTKCSGYKIPILLLIPSLERWREWKSIDTINMRPRRHKTHARQVLLTCLKIATPQAKVSVEMFSEA